MQGIRNNLATIVAGVLVVAGFVATTVFFGPWRAGTTQRLAILVHDANGRVQTLSLDQDARLAVHTDLGSNEVVVEGGTARMGQADCPHGDCLRQRAISHPGEQLVCLPHRLWVEVVAQDDAGTSVGALGTGDNAENSKRDVDLVSG
ncbi:MAG: NusG domain II-containing protein [Coriobacteriales bacterium]|nr:NusG domain II-containing protein [Coriobacteriales bacterium]